MYYNENAMIENCLVEGCNRPKRRNGPTTKYCDMHQRRVDVNGDPGLANPKRVFAYKGKKCLVDECIKPAKKKGLCEPHYNSVKNTTLSAQEIHDMKKSGCFVCHSFDMLRVDHDHNCCPENKSCDKCVRGILCHKCNTALGLLDDDMERIMSLASYLMINKDVLNNA